MKVLVIGNGGREHALAWKAGQSSRVERVFVAPGNAGTAADAENVEVPPDDVPRLLKFARDNQINFTIVGPEVTLGAGLVDAFQQAGLRVFGPSRAAAELETSKVFCKNLLRHADVATADYRVFRDAKAATTYLTDRDDMPIVVKADGLAAGKGVMVCDNREQALAAVERIAVDKEFGDAGKQIVIEERIHGEEASVLALTDGHTVLTLPACQDHKRAHDRDTGPNTGGMGAYCPTPVVTDQLIQHVEEKILIPTIHQMKRSRRPFRGVLYAGLMITNQGVKVLEYNVRFGDPECQPLLMRLNSDLMDLLEATADGSLDEIAPPQWDPRPAVCVVMAAEGYPGKYERGQPVRGLEEAAKVPDVKVFHAGTALQNGQVVTNGGRVLGVTALGSSISAAKLQAYTGVKNIRFSGAWCRKDISDKALTYKK
jgi:phosphoribosylamine--glycine ligase